MLADFQICISVPLTYCIFYTPPSHFGSNFLGILEKTSGQISGILRPTLGLSSNFFKKKTAPLMYNLHDCTFKCANCHK